MRIKRYEEQTDGVLLFLDKGKIKLEVCSDSIIHILYTRKEEFSDKESLMIVDKEYKSIQSQENKLMNEDKEGRIEQNELSISGMDKSIVLSWDFAERDGCYILKTSKIQLQINRQTGSFTYLDLEGNLLTKEPEDGGKTLIPTDVYKTVFDNQNIETEESVDGLKTRVKEGKKVKDREAFQLKLEFEWKEDEALYGLGSHEEGVMNLRNTHQYLYQHNMKAVVPVLISTRGYGVLLDNYSNTTFHDDLHGSYLWCEVADQLDYYFIYGPEFDDIVAGYRQLTGQVPLLPRWSFGYVQSKERYETQQELISVVKEYRERNVPLDVIIQDWKYWPEGCWGQKSFDKNRFPDPGHLTEELHEMGARLMISIWPNMTNPESDNHREMDEKGYMLGNQATYDAFEEGARKLYWQQANQGLFSYGIDGWWCDCTEPFEADWRGEYLPEPEKRMLINTEEFKKYLDPEYINAYSLEHSRGIYQGQRQTTDEKRVINLTRSSYAGQQRYATVSWSGDIAAKWEILQKQIPAGLNFCMAGLPYWTMDIGAFFVQKKHQWFWDGDYQDGVDDLGYRELYTRWFQCGTFLPMFRSHGTDTPREVWRFGEPGEEVYDTLVKFIHLRYRLFPYIYSLAAKVTFDNYTMMRALPFEFRDDMKTYDIKDQYMFGTALMVNPVTEPMYYQSGSVKLEGTKKIREVYLPGKCGWYDFWTGERYQGGRTIEARASLDTMPLFVKEGSIIPMGPVVQYSDQQKGTEVELRIYPGTDAEFTLYDDQGNNYRYEDGEYEKIHIKWDDEQSQLTFMHRQGSYPGMATEREFKIVMVSPGNGNGLETTQSEDKLIYRGENVIWRK